MARAVRADTTTQAAQILIATTPEPADGGGAGRQPDPEASPLDSGGRHGTTQQGPAGLTVDRPGSGGGGA